MSNYTIFAIWRWPFILFNLCSFLNVDQKRTIDPVRQILNYSFTHVVSNNIHDIRVLFHPFSHTRIFFNDVWQWNEAMEIAIACFENVSRFYLSDEIVQPTKNVKLTRTSSCQAYPNLRHWILECTWFSFFFSRYAIGNRGIFPNMWSEYNAL